MLCSIRNAVVAGTPLARLTIGVTNADGKRAAIEFNRDDATGDLVAEFPELPPPTPDELDTHYLTKMDWKMSFEDGLGEMWEDPINGGCYSLQNALDIQAAREFSDMVAEALSFEDTAIATFYCASELTK